REHSAEGLKVIQVGKKFGTIKLLKDALAIEVTTFRQEGPYSDGRHPDWVDFRSKIEEDLSRRDFTVNAMALEIFTQRLIDPFGGRKDLKHKVIRAVGDPEQRFTEDALRMLRFFRFQSSLGFRGDHRTEKAITPHLLKKISPERVREEVTKLLVSPQPARGLSGLIRTGLLLSFAPEFAGVVSDERLIFHVLTTVEAITPHPRLRWAALLHDLGKAQCRAVDARGLHYHGHAEVGAELARNVLERLRFSKDFIKRVTILVRWHMFSADPNQTDAALRRLACRVGEENLCDLLELRRADIIASGQNYHRAWEGFSAFASRLQALLQAEKVLTLRDLAVNGKDIMKVLGIPAGPQVGQILQELFAWITEEPGRNNREDLYRYLKERYLSGS
ncbi:MAG TPA: HD domain-containing protein, partial [Bacillota bacterium]